MYHPGGHLIILQAMHVLGPVMYEKSLYFQLNNSGNVNFSKIKVYQKLHRDYLYSLHLPLSRL